VRAQHSSGSSTHNGEVTIAIAPSRGCPATKPVSASPLKAEHSASAQPKNTADDGPAPDVASGKVQSMKLLKDMDDDEREVFMQALADEMTKKLRACGKPMPSSALYRRIADEFRLFPQAKASEVFKKAAARSAAKLIADQWAIPGESIMTKPKSKSEIRDTPFAADKREMTACIEKAIVILENEGGQESCDELFEKSGAKAKGFQLRWFKWAMADRARRAPEGEAPRIIRGDAPLTYRANRPDRARPDGNPERLNA
jgi:hypothetical protein